MVGTAGWALPAADRHAFGEGESNLARYATRFDCVEINSSFYRPHRSATWRRWADSVPAAFRFAVKLPKSISHDRRLEDCASLIDAFAEEIIGLGDKLAVVLVQLAPSHALDAPRASSFFAELAARVSATIVCEPRHPSWFSDEADALLCDSTVSRVAADPAVVPSAALPGGCLRLRYWRLHGSPAIYRSSYDPAAIAAYAKVMLDADSASTWCIFDNTAASAATGNALTLAEALRSAGER